MQVQSARPGKGKGVKGEYTSDSYRAQPAAFDSFSRDKIQAFD